jgi:cell division septal protein FtsQ
MRGSRAEPRRVPAATRSVVPRGPLRPRVRLLILVVGVLALCGVASAVGYRALRDSSLFDVHRVVITGAGASLTSQVDAAVRTGVGGRSMLALDSGSLARTIEQVPGVHVARVDRDFPSTLRVRIWSEHAVAIAVSGHDRVLVSSSGRVLAPIGRRSRPPDLPRVGLPGHGVPHAGSYIRNPAVLSQLAVAAAIPDRFGARVGWIRSDPAHGLYAELHWPALRIRIGPSVDLGEKMRAAALVLQAYPTLAMREELSYVDVSAPSRPAVLPKTPDPATASLATDTSSSGTSTSGSSTGTGTASSSTGSTDSTTTATTDSTVTSTTSTSTNP